MAVNNRSKENIINEKVEEFYDFNEVICEIDQKTVTLINFDEFLCENTTTDIKSLLYYSKLNLASLYQLAEFLYNF
jgi:hypothetical protein